MSGGAWPIQQPAEHVSNMILSAEEHGQDAHCLCGLVELEPKDRSIDRHVPQARRNIVVKRA